MELRKLWHAEVLAREETFVRASSVLNLTQSALSRSIQSLEAELGVRLFDRLPSGVRVTMAGRRLLDHARAIQREMGNLRQDALLLRKAAVGSTTFGVGPMFAPLLGVVLADTTRQAPRLEITAAVKPVGELATLLADDQLDFYLADTSQAMGRKDFAVSSIARIPVGYFVRADHPLARRGALGTAELTQYALASTTLPTDGAPVQAGGGGSWPTGWAGRIVCEDVRALKAAALASDAVLFAMEPTLEPEVQSGALRRLVLADFADRTSAVGIVTLLNRTLSEPAKQVIGRFERLLGASEAGRADAP